MATKALEKDRMTKTYCEVENLIKWTVTKFMQTKGGDFDDLMEKANYYFVEAYKRYDGRTKLSYYIRYRVWYGLLDEHCIAARKARVSKIVELEPNRDERRSLEGISERLSCFNLMSFLEELSEDARLCAKLVLDTPTGLAKCIREYGGRPKHYRSVIREYLVELGWPTTRVTKAFKEVGELLRHNKGATQ